jgi:hypothetical protein
MSVTVQTYNNDIPSRCFILFDVVSVEYTTNVIGGFIDATIELLRRPGRSYQSLGYNYHLVIKSRNGRTVWEGRVSELPQGSSDGKDNYTVKAEGYYANLSDRVSAWKPYYNDGANPPTLYDIAQIIRDGVNGYATYLVIDTSTAPNVGRAIKFIPDNAASVRSHIDELMSYGNSSDYNLSWQVWEGRKLYLSVRQSIQNMVKYKARVKQAKSYNLGLSSDVFFNLVTVKYTDSISKTVKTVQVQNTSMQNKYATSFGSSNPAATRSALVREAPVIDITSHGEITQTQATMVANTLLQKYSSDGVRLISSDVTYDRPGSIKNYTSNQSSSFCNIRANNAITFSDLSGFQPSESVKISSMFIGQTTYRWDGKKETITFQSENSRSPEEILTTVLTSFGISNIRVN